MRADRAAREVQNEDDRVGDRPGLGLCQADRPGQRLDRRHLARQRALEVDVVASTLEDLPAALGLVHEPRPAGHGAEVPADEHGDLLPAERLARLLEELARVPLVPDRAHRRARLGRRHDRVGVGQRAGDRLLEIDVHAGGQGRLDGPAVVERRRAHPQHVEILALEHLLPARVRASAARAGDRLGPVGVDVAGGDELDARRGVDRRHVDSGDPAAADDPCPKRRHPGG